MRQCSQKEDTPLTVLNPDKASVPKTKQNTALQTHRSDLITSLHQKLVVTNIPTCALSHLPVKLAIHIDNLLELKS